MLFKNFQDKNNDDNQNMQNEKYESGTLVEAEYPTSRELRAKEAEVLNHDALYSTELNTNILNSDPIYINLINTEPPNTDPHTKFESHKIAVTESPTPILISESHLYY